MTGPWSLTRRSALGMVGAGLFAAQVGAERSVGDADARLRRVLDGLEALPDAAQRLAALTGFSPAVLSPSARLDLETVRIGLGFEARLALLPAGAAGRYALELARACGGAVDPGAAERALDADAARLDARAEQLFARLGLRGGSLGARFRQLLADPRHAYPDSDAGRDAAVAQMNRWLAAARAALPRWFTRLPRECGKVRVRRLSAEERAAGKGGFRTLPAPGRGGDYAVDLGQIARRPGWTLHSVVHHELLPGHMVQLPIQQAADPHPLRLRYAAAFSEGWAVYAEGLAWRGGLIASPAEQLGAVHWLLFRTLRGLADIGLHHRGWRGQDARAMFERRMGFPVYFAPFAADVDRIAAEPGQRAAEALIALRIGAGARRAPDLAAYHARVLAEGARPLALCPPR